MRAFSVGGSSSVFGGESGFGKPGAVVNGQEDLFGFGVAGNNLGDEDLFGFDLFGLGGLITDSETKLMDQTPNTGDAGVALWYQKAKQAVAIYDRLYDAMLKVASPVWVDQAIAWVGNGLIDGTRAYNRGRVTSDIKVAEQYSPVAARLYGDNKWRNRVEDLENTDKEFAAYVENGIKQYGLAREIIVEKPVEVVVERRVEVPGAVVRTTERVEETPVWPFVVGGVAVLGAFALVLLRK